ncbi:MAG: hypothetical protein OEM67_02340 [Thermoleophilia bacterium]|nr:hypothetical protein [Thermoleophilia bacterium]MDH3725757.1 hypothetical protein [Thermoleophilia bacterium]
MPTRAMRAAALALVAGVLLAFALMVPEASAANRGSPERLWEAFPLDPSATTPGTGENGITLGAPEPLPSAPPESAGDPDGDDATDALPPAARTSVDDDEGGGGVGTGVLLAIAAGALLVIVVLAAALRNQRAPKEVSDVSYASPEPDEVRHGSPYASSPAIDAKPEPAPIAASVAVETPRPHRSDDVPPKAPKPEPRMATPPVREPATPAREPQPPAPSAAAAPEVDVPQIYGPALCLEFASGLRDEVLERAIVLFGLLSRYGSVDSVTAANALGVTPRELPGLIITPLRRRADALALPSAYMAERDERTRRRRWRDRDGVAGRLREAAITIKTARSVANGDAAPAGRATRATR